jgi:hypothetical protein
MVTISEELKSALRSNGNEFEAYITDGVDTISADDDLVALSLVSEGKLGKTVMRELTGSWNGEYNLLGSSINLLMGGHTFDIVNKGTATITIANPSVITLTAHGLNTGDRIRLTTTGALPTGLAVDTDYYVIRINDNTFNLATTYENAFMPTRITTTGSQSGTHTVTYYSGQLSETIEYIDYGTFEIVEVQKNEGSLETDFKAYDLMYKSLAPYGLSLDFSTPQTLLQILQAICTELGWTLATTSFVNDDIEYTNDVFAGIGLSYREVLEDIAEASGTMIMFNTEDELELREFGGSVVDTLTSDDLLDSSTEGLYGELNQLSLSRMPQEDNIVELDSTSQATYGVIEYKIINNIALDSDRASYITPLFNAIKLLKYYPSDNEAIGTIELEVGDRIIIEDPDENQLETVITRIDINEFNVSIESEAIDKGDSPLQYAGVIGQKIKNTQIIVDKQQGEIQLLVDETASIVLSNESISLTAQNALDLAESNQEGLNTQQSQITTLEQTVDNLTISVSNIGGSNLLNNSSGLKGTIEEWKEDESEARNDGTIEDTTSTRENTEAGVGIRINNQYIKQTVPTLTGEVYTLYCRFFKTNTTNANISGVGNVELTGNNSEWTVFKYQFTASSNSTTIIFDTNGAYCILADIVLKSGDVNGWVQAPNEVYGANFRFDKDGFKISSLTDSFESILDNQSLSVRDTSADRTVMRITKDEGLVTKLTAQDELTVQRYENSESAVRFIPTSTGLILVIND